MSKRIVIVGGGSSGWGPKLMADLLLTPSLQDSTFILHDLNATNAQRIAAFSEKFARELGITATITPETDPEQALRGADFVLITISTGGLDAMAHDVQLPEEYSIYHTVGDTVGPGGWARCLRNIPVFRQLAERVNRLAPQAIVLNYTNPLASLTKTLLLSTDRPVVGLCHGVFENLEFLKELFGLESEDDIACTYAGLNHFFWITGFTIAGQDGYALLRDKIGSGTFADLYQKVYPNHGTRLLASELFHTTGLLPYIGDRHTSEFLAPYLTSQENIARYGLVRTSIEDRRQGLAKTTAGIDDMIAGEITDRYRQRSRETAADIINAFVTGTPFIDVGNVANIGQVDNVLRGSVLETPVLVTAQGFQPVAMGPLPEPIRSWVERVARVQDMTVQAGLAGDLDQALMALALDPLTSHLSLSQVQDLGLRLLRANAAYLPQFQGQL